MNATTLEEPMGLETAGGVRSSLVDAIVRMGDAHRSGNIDARLETDRLTVGDGRAAEAINAMVDLHVGVVLDMITVLGAYGDGDFRPVLRRLPGKQAQANECLDALRASVSGLIAEVEQLSRAAIEGRLAARADAGKFRGDFRRVIEGLNQVLDAVVGPLNVAAEYVDRIGKGEIPPKLTDRYAGDFAEISNNLNACLDGLAGLQEANAVLKRLEANDYTKAVTGHCNGIFAEVGKAINEVRDHLLRLQKTAVHIAAGDLSDIAAFKAIGDGAGRRSTEDEIVPAYIHMMESLRAKAEVAEQIAAGNISVDIPVASQADMLGKAMVAMKQNIDAVLRDTRELATAAIEGRLKTRADAGRHQGEFRSVIEAVNGTLDAVVGPLALASAYMDRISRGDIPPVTTTEVHGDFNEIKDSLNRCVEAVNALVADSTRLTEAAAAGRINTRADVTRHGGSFKTIIDGVNRTLDLITKPIAEIAQQAQTLGSSSEELSAISHQMAGSAEETATQVNVVSAASEQITTNLTSVASSSEEMQASIREIARSASEAARMAKGAHAKAQATNATVHQLGESSSQIGKVVKVITTIAQQTNLLALNATIEAARAGEAGKGFAVVAQEVKELARETAKATEDIGAKIEAIQSDTRSVVSAIDEIRSVVAQIDEASTTIASAVEEQTATTNEIGRNIAEAARGGGEISRNIGAVAVAAGEVAKGADETQKAAKALTEMAGHLQSVVGRFTI